MTKQLFEQIDDHLKYIDDLLNEFVDIKGYENLYMINRKGQVYSNTYKKIMITQKTQDDYYFVTLTIPKIVNNKVERTRHKGRIHRLIALQFIPNPNNYPEVDHIDRNRSNNDITNLRWVTRCENRRNRDDIIENLTEEQKEERLQNLREYKRVWAENDRRTKGIRCKSEMTLTKDPDYYNKWAREARANETPEQREIRLQQRREKYKTKPQTEEQKEKARERARKQRENKKITW